MNSYDKIKLSHSNIVEQVLIRMDGSWFKDVFTIYFVFFQWVLNILKQNDGLKPKEPFGIYILERKLNAYTEFSEVFIVFEKEFLESMIWSGLEWGFDDEPACKYIRRYWAQENREIWSNNNQIIS